MEAPQLLLVPATPIYSKPRPLSPTSPIIDTAKLHRNSAEAAIVSIYSMYGDEDGTNTWATSTFEPVDRRRSRKKAKRAGIVRSKDNLLSPQETYNPTEQITPHDDPYYSTHSDPQPPSNSLLPALPIDSNHPSATTNTNSPPTPDSRSDSALSTSSDTTFETASVGRSSTESNRDQSTTTPATGPSILITSPRSRSRSPRKRPPSALRKSIFAKRELPPVPAEHPPSSRPSTPSKTPSPPSLSSRNQSRTTSPSSKVSLTPSQGEDPDAFLVRSTYALLDEQGVKGDGYEEGVERTRAKIGPSRACQLDAEKALGDPGEKSRELNAKEIETLSSLDRYGFFTIPSHDRLVLLPSTPLRKRLSVSPPGSSDAPSDATPLPSLPPVPLPSKETSRIGKWNRMIIPSARDVGGNIESWTIKSSKQPKLRRRVYKGIPDRWRTAAWDLLMSRFARMDKFDLAKIGAEYRDALDKPSSYDIQIDLDVPRTISGHILFHTRYGVGQRSLFHVLHSFSLRCPECGYVQGMGPIAATLLCYFEPERVYASLVRLHDAYDMHRIFSPGFPGLLEAIYVQERLTKMMMPNVYAAFGRHMVSTTAYATKWYITLFANSVPFQTQLRLWDAFLLEGPDVFVAMAVAIVWVYRDQITSRSANFETVLSLLSSFFVPEDENVLLSWIRKMLGDPKLRSSMTLWRMEWKRLVVLGEDSKALL